MDWLQNLDVTFFRFLNGRLINPVFDQVMPFLSGNAFFIPAVLLLGLLVIWKFRARGAVFFILLALSVGLADGLICRNIKKAVGRDRPFLTLPDARCLLGKGGSASMPSSHAANWFAATIVAYVFFRRSVWVMLPLACAVSFSRVYCGVHYPSDVIAGAILGAGTGAATLWLVNELWIWAGRKWFPLWWEKYPLLLAPPPAGADRAGEEEPRFAPRRKPGEKQPRDFAPPHLSLDDHWLRLGYLTLALLLIGRLAYIASNVIQLSPEEAFYWLRSKHIAGLELNNAPLPPLLVLFGSLIFGDTALGVRFFSPVFSALTGFMLLRFFAKNVNARAGFFLVLIITATPLLAAGSILLNPDFLNVFLWTALMISGWRAVQVGSSIRPWLLVGFWMALISLSGHGTGLPLLVLLLFIGLWKPATKKFRGPGPYVALVIYLSGVALTLFAQSSHFKYETPGSLKALSGGVFANEIIWANPIFLGAAVWAAAAFWKRNRHNPFLFYCFCLGPVPFLILQPFSTRWSTPAPALIPLVCLMVAFWDIKWRFDSRRLKPWLVGGLALGLGAVLIGHETNWVSKISVRPLPIRFDPLANLRCWSDTARVVNEKRQALSGEDKAVFIIASDSGLAAELSFYIPEAKVAVKADPLVCIFVDRQDDDQRWLGYSDRKGESAIFVTDRVGALAPEKLQQQFESIADLGARDVLYHGQVLRSLQFFACRRLK